MKKSVIISLSTVGALLVTAAGVGASTQLDVFNELLTHTKEYSFDNRQAQEDFQADSGLAPGSTQPREWAADDATNIRIAFVTTQDPGWNIRFDSATGLSPRLLIAGECSPVAHAPKPAIDVDWLPDRLSGAVFFCESDQAYVTEHGGTVYGWQAA